MRVVKTDENGGGGSGGGGGGDFKIPDISPGQIRRVVSVALIVILVLLAIQLRPWYTVGLDERAVVLRFGRYHRMVGPGLKLKIPLVEEIVIENVTQIRKIEIGYQSTVSGGKRVVAEEALMMTGDEALVHLELSLFYQVADPFQFRIQVRNADETLKDIAEAAIRQFVGDREIDEVLTYGRQEFAQAVLPEVQTIADSYNLGVYIQDVNLEEGSPPQQVASAFRDVQNAKTQNQQLELEAQGYTYSRIPDAEAKVATMLREAEAYEQEKIAKAKGEVQRFDALLREYRSAEEVTRTRLYLETLENVLGGRKKVIIESSSGVLPLLNLTEVIHDSN